MKKSRAQHRLLAFALSLLMLISIMPVKSFADDIVIITHDLKVKGGVEGVDYRYLYAAVGVHPLPRLEIYTSTPLTISGKSTQMVIYADNRVNANIILDGVDIDVSGKQQTAPIDFYGAGSCTITTAPGSKNTLKGGTDSAGISVPGGARVLFNGTGELNVYGGRGYPAIGRDDQHGYVEIQSGNIYAQGGSFAPGIGSSITRDCNGVVAITGGNVTAKAGTHMAAGGAAGIGGAAGGKCGRITISGGNVNAIGSGKAPGIGGGSGINCADPSISNGGVSIIHIYGGIVNSTGGQDAKSAIGGGMESSSENDIRITGGLITANGNIDSNGKLIIAEGGVVFADSIKNKRNINEWQGVVFEGNDGRVYGSNPYIHSTDVTIPQNKKLLIGSGQNLFVWDKTLTVASGASIVNNGHINNSGEILVNLGGSYSGAQPEQGKKVKYQIDWDTNGDGVADKSEYLSYDSQPNPPSAYKESTDEHVYVFTGWSETVKNVTAPAFYKAQFTKETRMYDVAMPSGEHYTVSYNGADKVPYNTQISFSVDIDEGYSKTDAFNVKANGQVLTQDQNGRYNYTVTGDTAITVEGVADITPPSQPVIKYDTNGFMEVLNNMTFRLFFKETVKVTISSEDQGSGVKEFTYQLGDSQPITVQAQNNSISFNVAPEFKGNIKNVTVKDFDSNITQAFDYEYFAVESEQPSKPVVDTNGYTSDSWTNKDVKLYVSDSTAISGIAKYQYSVDGGSSWHDATDKEKTEATIDSPLNVSKAELDIFDEGTASYIFRAVSNAGNVSLPTDPVTVKIDKTEPAISLTGDTTTIKQSDDLSISTSVGVSGVSQVLVSKDGGQWQDITQTYNRGYKITQNGVYTFKVINGLGTEKLNSIEYNNIDSQKPVVKIDSKGYIDNTWSTKDVTLEVSNQALNLGTTTFSYRVDEGSWQEYKNPIVVSDDTKATTYHFKAQAENGLVSDEVSITVKKDETAPKGDIFIKENSVKKFINDISFGLFFKENVDIKITASDDTSGVKSTEYYRSDKILTQEEVLNLNSWTEYKSIKETAVDAEKFIYYVKVTDDAGNVSYFGSNGVTFDLTAPAFDGVKDGETYYTTQKVIVNDDNLESVYVNGNAQSNPFTLKGDVDTQYIIKATDKAGNVTEMTVNMKTIESLEIKDITADNVTSDNKEMLTDFAKDLDEKITDEDTTEDEKAKLQDLKTKAEQLLYIIEKADKAAHTENIIKVENINKENVQPSNKEDLLAAKSDIETALKDYENNYTDKEKAALNNRLEEINEALYSIKKAQDAMDAIKGLPDKVEVDDTETEKDILDAKDKYDSLSDHEKSLVEKELKDKLESLLDSLDDYRIIEGNGSKWTKNSEKGLTITANGALSKFTGLKIDGKAVDAKNYAAVSGSTVVTLKPEYLNTLSAGKHTITFMYTNGEVSTDFTIENAANVPKNGDNSNMLLLSFILLISGAGAIYITKKKTKSK